MAQAPELTTLIRRMLVERPMTALEVSMLKQFRQEFSTRPVRPGDTINFTITINVT